MKIFVGLVDWPHGSVTPDVQRRYESGARRAGLVPRWCVAGRLAAFQASDDETCPGQIARYSAHVGVGDVRLDNRGDLQRWARCNDPALTDLDLVTRVIAKHGAPLIPAILGDFAFLVWNESTGTALAACDAFAVKKLYYTACSNALVVASRAEALVSAECYDVQYLAELLAYCSVSPGRSVYSEVSALPPATIATFANGRLALERYWSALDLASRSERAPATGEAIATCRRLLAEAVSSRLESRGTAWAQLSGGLDSSSVVGVAQWLSATGVVSAGLGGTVTFVDSHGTGADEREYSNAVAEACGLGNEKIIDAVPWQEDESGPPILDQPSGLFPLYARDRELARILHAAGSRVLLTGQGGDDLFGGNMFFFADWLATGHATRAFQEMARRAATGRVSFWDLAYRNAVLPLLPPPLQRRLLSEEGSVPPWISPRVSRRYGLHRRASAPLAYAGRVGSKYGDAVAAVISALPGKVPTGVLEDALDVRHPYLYRPLVEFALRLPPELTVRPYSRKWILREAMRGILPDVVRTRVGKGVMYGSLSWSMIRHRTYLGALLQDPILAQLGIIDAAKLRSAFVAAQYERDRRLRISPSVQYTLAIEAWLQVRSGRWPVGLDGKLPATNRGAPNGRGNLRRQA